MIKETIQMNHPNFQKIFGVRKDNELGDESSNGDTSEASQSHGCTREEALKSLLNTRSGQALIARTKRRQPMNRLDQLKSIVKSNGNGLTSIAKCIVDGQPSGLSEHEFAQLIMIDSERTKQANETREQAFSRRFCAQDEEGALLRKAHAIVKNMPMMAPTPMGTKAQPPVDTSTSALKQLEAMASDLHKREPQLSPEQAFAKVYAQHTQLAAAERQQNRPRVA